MDNQDRIEEQLKGVNDKLALINQNMLKVFWIVAVFAFFVLWPHAIHAFYQSLNDNMGGLAERTGLEPATPGVTGRYSNQLNYRSNLWVLHHCVNKYRSATSRAAHINANKRFRLVLIANHF